MKCKIAATDEKRTYRRKACSKDAMAEGRLPLKFPTAVLAQVELLEAHLIANHIGRHVYFGGSVCRPVSHRQDVHSHVYVTRKVVQVLNMLQRHTHVVNCMRIDRGLSLKIAVGYLPV